MLCSVRQHVMPVTLTPSKYPIRAVHWSIFSSGVDIRLATGWVHVGMSPCVNGGISKTAGKFSTQGS